MKRLALVAVTAAFVTACSLPGQKPASTEQPDPSVSAPTAPQQNYRPGDKHQQALKLIGDEDYPAAETLLNQVVAAEPQAAEAWNDLSLVQARLGRFRAAAKSATQALKLRPGFAFAEFNLGLALLQTGDGWQEAKPHLEASAKAQPDRPEPLHALGIWYRYSGDLKEARSYLQKAHAMKYGPAWPDLVGLDQPAQKSQAVTQVAARFPDAPVQLIWNLMQGYVQQGYTRRIERVIPIRLRPKGETYWAALLREESPSDKRTSVQFESLDALSHYMGETALKGAGPVDLQVIDSPGGQHLLIAAQDRSLVCGLKGRFVESLFAEPGPIKPAPGGITAKGTFHRFVPEVSQYLDEPTARKLEGLITAIRAAGHKINTDSAVWAALELGTGGGAGLALAWGGGVAFKPEGDSVTVYSFANEPQKYRISYHYPHGIGKVTVSNHVFLAIQTLQPGGPNGANVLILEYNAAGKKLNPIFAGESDGAGFRETYVFTSFKRYLPQGGYERYVTDYVWDEQKYTFVAEKTWKAER